MRIWQWLSKIGEDHRRLLLNSSMQGDQRSVWFLLKHVESFVTSRKELEKIAKKILKKIKEDENLAVKALAHEVLGKIFFEKGIFSAAEAQFKEAYDALKKIDALERSEAALKLLTWLGLTSLRLGKYREAENFLERVIMLLRERYGENTIVGEIMSLYADAITYRDPEEAINIYESAHNILVKSPGPFLLSNAVKLSSALFFRRYTNEAATILGESFKDLLKITKWLNIEIIKSMRILYNKTLGKAITHIDLSYVSDLWSLSIGLEGIKGLYFEYKAAIKPIVNLASLEEVNKKILRAAQTRNLSLLDALINGKETKIRLYSSNFLLKSTDIINRSLAFAFDRLYRKFGTVNLLLFHKTQNPEEYVVILLRYPKKSGIIKKIIVSEDLIKSVPENPQEGSKKIKEILPEDILEEISRMEGILLISPSDLLHEVTWEILPYNNQRWPYISLNIPVVRISSMFELLRWNFGNRVYSYGKLALIQHNRERKKEGIFVSNELKKKGLRVIRNIGDSIFLVLGEYISVLHYIDKIIETPNGNIFIKLGDFPLSIRDIEILNIRGGIAILNVSNSIASIIDEFGYHNLPIAFNISGFSSSIAINGSIDVKKSNLLPLLYYLNNGEEIWYHLLNIRRNLYDSNSSYWYKYVLYGNPLTRLG